MKSMSAVQAWGQLGEGAVLVDVRTPQEWAFVGLPDAARVPVPLVRITWNPQDLKGFAAALQAAVPDRAAALYFLCRSGARSHAAGEVAGALGYGDVTNIADGFEDRHGPGTGWQAGGLPSCLLAPE